MFSAGYCEKIVRSSPRGGAGEAAILLAVAGGYFGQSQAMVEMLYPH